MVMTEGANSAGAWLAGMVPHRQSAGRTAQQIGLDSQAILKAQLKSYFLLGLEPELDCANPHKAMQAMQAAELVVVLSPFASEAMRQYADVILPMAAFTETSGTFVNLEGQWQSFKGCVEPYGEARPAWKVLRVLANVLAVDGFDYHSSQQIRDELKQSVKETSFNLEGKGYWPDSITSDATQLCRMTEWPVYATDSLVRRAQALQDSASNETSAIAVNSQLAKRLSLAEKNKVTLAQDDETVNLSLSFDEHLPDQCVWVAGGVFETAKLGDPFGIINIKSE